MELTIKQTFLLISILLLFVELFLYLKIKLLIKHTDSDKHVLLQLKIFFGQLSSFHEFIYMFIYVLLLMIAYYYLPIIYLVLFLQSVSLITDIYVYFLIVKSAK